MTPEFTHCALHVRDLNQSIAFYESYCALRVVREHGKGCECTVWMGNAADRGDRAAGRLRQARAQIHRQSRSLSGSATYSLS
jgi:catechol 2,3-dioxygenase-like lactoylglutathione lyase family enzyme